MTSERLVRGRNARSTCWASVFRPRQARSPCCQRWRGPSRVAYDRLAEGFGAGFNGPLVLAATTPADGSGQAALDRVQTAVAADRDVAFVSPPRLSPRGDAAVLNVIPRSSPQDERTTHLVVRLRDDVLPAATRGSQTAVYVGGATATFQDLADKIAGRLPIFIAIVVGLSVLLSMAVFRSLWVPLVSAAFNLLSIAAAYGVVVLLFQQGVGASLLGVDGEVPIVSFVPLLMFAILFGLSMDYNPHRGARGLRPHARPRRLDRSLRPRRVRGRLDDDRMHVDELF